MLTKQQKFPSLGNTIYLPLISHHIRQSTLQQYMHPQQDSQADIHQLLEVYCQVDTRPAWRLHATTLSEPDVREHLEQIQQYQKQPFNYHKLMLDNIYFLIYLLTRVPQTPSTTNFHPTVLCSIKVLVLPLQQNTPDQQQTSTTDQHELIGQDELFAVRSRATSILQSHSLTSYSHRRGRKAEM